MDAKEFITMVLVVFLSLWGALYVETGMSDYFALELLVILVLTIAAVGIFYSIATSRRKAWKSLAAFFIASIINAVLVYTETKGTEYFSLVMLVNIGGLALVLARHPPALLKRKEAIPELPPMPVYHINESDIVDHIDVEPYYGDEIEVKETKKQPRKKQPKKRKRK